MEICRDNRRTTTKEIKLENFELDNFKYVGIIIYTKSGGNKQHRHKNESTQNSNQIGCYFRRRGDEHHKLGTSYKKKIADDEYERLMNFEIKTILNGEDKDNKDHENTKTQLVHVRKMGDNKDKIIMPRPQYQHRERDQKAIEEAKTNDRSSNKIERLQFVKGTHRQYQQ